MFAHGRETVSARCLEILVHAGESVSRQCLEGEAYSFLPRPPRARRDGLFSRVVRRGLERCENAACGEVRPAFIDCTAIGGRVGKVNPPGLGG